MGNNKEFLAKVSYKDKANDFTWSAYVDTWTADVVVAYKTAIAKLKKEKPHLARGHYHELFPDMWVEDYEFTLEALTIDYKAVKFSKYRDESSYYSYWGEVLEFDPANQETFQPLIDYIRSEADKKALRQWETKKVYIVTGEYNHGD